jgi:quinol monooxygenase YgiN
VKIAKRNKMKANRSSILAASVLSLSLCSQAQAQYVRLAELEIDPAQLNAFKEAVTAGVQAAIRLEPGVLVLYAVFEKDNPNQVRVFEMYTDAAAYTTHLEMPHFKHFRAATDKMVLSRKLLDAVPIVLGAKAQLPGASR